MSQVHRLLESAEYRARAAAPHGHLSNLLIKQSIHKAEIFHADVPNEDPKATTLPQKVTIVAREYSSELTASFRRPYTSTYRACFADDYPDLLDAAQTKSILIQHEISKTAVGIAAAMVVTSWLLLSALIGIVRKNMEAGFTVAGVGIGVMALFVAVIKGIQK
ncbi:hypothetical protein K4K57_006617 [Colletotrichum sp. SAR 10_99]|nr:hypothetical protein K4K55_010754 [Colletotrichum sp. SAR 10_96]KAJ5018040.1 hypothetical protein K4K57_006617 [Colletotrichum sp. SAR 10_99]